MDGNFKMAPTMFLQLYVIRAKLDGGSISCVYALLTNKSGQIYQRMMIAIMQRCYAIGAFPAPTSVKVDFEMAMHNALRAIFGPLIGIDGCFFHLCGNTWKHLQELGLTVFYRANYQAKKFVGMMDGLAFLPVQDLQAGVAIVRQELPHQSFLPLLDYFLSTYVGVMVVNGNGQQVFQQPLFPPQTWNVHNITLNGGDRTNNVCEGWNNGFKSKVGDIHHPPVYRLIEGLQTDYAEVKTNLLQSQNGVPLRVKTKRAYRNYQASCLRYCQQYQRGVYGNNIRGFLTDISHGIRF